MLHALLAIESRDTLLGNPKLGDSYEGIIIEQVLSVISSDTHANFYRTAAGAEIDLRLEFGTERWAIEIKHSSAPATSRGFYEGTKDIQATRKIVIYPGLEHYRTKDGTEIMPVTSIIRELAERP